MEISGSDSLSPRRPAAVGSRRALEPPREMRPYRADIQMIFQDPYSSLNPRMTVGQIVEEPLTNSHARLSAARARRPRGAGCSRRSGCRRSTANRYPHEFSGGQRQRIGIARALATNPKIVIADEPVSALDVSIQAQVINLMQDLQEEFGLSYLFIAHDLSVVRHISDSHRGDVSGQHRRDRPGGRDLPQSAASRIRARCSRPCRAPIRTVAREGRIRLAATCPIRSTSRPAARSARAARSPSPPAPTPCRRSNSKTAAGSPAPGCKSNQAAPRQGVPSLSDGQIASSVLAICRHSFDILRVVRGASDLAVLLNIRACLFSPRCARIRSSSNPFFVQPSAPPNM